AYGTRHTRTEYTDLSRSSQSPEQSYSGVSPKLGLLWQVSRPVQVFGNVSRSFEPPVLQEFNDAYDNSHVKLDAQSATTIELGTRGALSSWRWQLALYQAWVHDEILSSETPPNSGIFQVANADKTRHQGIEFGLDGRLPLNWF